VIFTVSIYSRIVRKLRLWANGCLTWTSACGIACLTLLIRTHAWHWRKVAKAGPPPWDVRNRVIADFIPDGSSVLDLGCGAQTLKLHLKSGCTYQPCDVITNSPDTIHCDFNAGIYPKIIKRYDYVVCSGLLEYVRTPSEFLQRISSFGDALLISYNPIVHGESKIQRLGKHWVNHLAQPELERIFESIGLSWNIVNTRPPNELLYSCKPKTE